MSKEQKPIAEQQLKQLAEKQLPENVKKAIEKKQQYVYKPVYK